MKRPLSDNIFAKTIFLDSGAYGLYNIHVRKIREPNIGKGGIELAPPKVIRGRGDFSYYSLKPGSDFRKYCDRYGRWLQKVLSMGLDDLLYVNIDVITNPDMTWEVQQYLEKEYGVKPMPVIHAGTPFKYIARYLDTGRYDLIGLGGLGQNIGLETYRRWADAVFIQLCPESNKYLPIVRVHGFAMTSWEFICRWPWWSLDSATWVKLAAYGWLYISRYVEGKGWDYSRPPLQINVSFRSPFLKKKHRHRDVIGPDDVRKLVDRWLKRCGLGEGYVEKKNVPVWDLVPEELSALHCRRFVISAPTQVVGEPKEWGIQTHFGARAQANLHYFKDLEESRPKWPHPLDPGVIHPKRVKAFRGIVKDI